MKLTRDAFCDLRNEAQRALRRSKETPSVLICAGTGCIAGGAMKIYENLRAECESRNLPVYIGLKHDTDEEKSLHVKMSGCHGFCEMGPLVHIEPMGIMYIHVKPEDCHEILEKTVLGGEIIDRLVYRLNGVAYPRQEDIPFYKKQHRVVLENCGTSDAEDIEEYIAKGGYSGFERALFEMTDQQICQDIIDSGLRGRGGGGFPAGSKWDGARCQKADKKYIVCNGDEGDPGAFMDRSIMEGNPHSVLEGMMIAGLAAGSDEGYIYVRAEYPLAVSRLKAAIAKAQELGLLGDDILGSGFNFHLHVNRGAGAFVCGEGSALTSSIEGKRGMPRVKPPRTIEHGLWGKPTVLNNVETFANVPLIIRNGVDWYRHIGTEKSPGTKAFALTGNVVNTGLIEVPMGTTVREVIFDIGGGIKDGKKFKAVRLLLRQQRASGPAPGLRLSEEDRGHDRLRRPGGHGRGHLHGGDCPLLHELHPERELRQVRPLPGGHQAHAGDPGPHRQQRGHHGGPGAAGESVQHHYRDGSVRPGPERLQARPEHPALLPGRVSGPCGGPPLSHLQWPQAPSGDHPRAVQGLRQVRPELSHGRHFRPDPHAPRHRHHQVYPLRRLLGSLPLRRYRRH